MYHVPYDSHIRSDRLRSGLEYGYTSSIFDDLHEKDGEESKVDHENGSIQYSIHSNEQMKQEEQSELSDIDMIRRRATLLKQKFMMIGRYDDLLDMDSLYSQSNCGDAANKGNETGILASHRDPKQDNIEIVNHNSQHSFGSLYSASSSSARPEDSASDETLGEPSHSARRGSTKSHQEPLSLAMRKAKTLKGDSFGTESKKAPNEHRFNFTTTPKRHSPCAVSHGEIEDILEQLENDAVRGLSDTPAKNIPYAIATHSEEQPLKDRDAASIQSIVTEDSDDYGFSNDDGSTHHEVCRHEMEPRSNARDLKRPIDYSQKPCDRPVDLSPPVKSDPEGVAWNSQQVDLFLNEYQNLHKRHEADVETLESRVQDHLKIEAELKKEVQTLIKKDEEKQLELRRTKEALSEARQYVQSKVRESENLRSEKAKMEQNNADLVVLIQKCKSEASERERNMKHDYQALKDSSMAMSLTLEYRLARFEDMVNGLQEHTRKLEQDHNSKIKGTTEKLEKQKRITKKYKKKYLSVSEERDSLIEELKSKRSKIVALQKKLKKQKESNSMKISDPKKQLRKSKKTKKSVN